MQVSWMDGARRDVENADPALRDQIDSEIATLFAEGDPGYSARYVSGILMIELPCGVEIDFERDDEGARIVFAKIP